MHLDRSEARLEELTRVLISLTRVVIGPNESQTRRREIVQEYQQESDKTWLKKMNEKQRREE